MDLIKKMTEQQTETKRPTIMTSLGPNPTIEKEIPEDVEWIDDAFYIKKTRFGMYTSVLKEPILGANFITGATYDAVLTVSRWHLKCLQDGSIDEYTRVINSGVVGGKL